VASVESQATVHGRIVDSDTAAPLPGVLVQAQAIDAGNGQPSPTQTQSDSTGSFSLVLSSGAGGSGRVEWQLTARCIGYSPTKQQLTIEPGGVVNAIVLSLEPQPLMLDEMVVRMRRPSSGEAEAGFVEVIKVTGGASSGTDLPAVLDRALGLQVRRYGGLGSSASISIRGSTAEQVLICLDGVPLNQASGGGVDIGYLPLAGVEEIEVYRGAVPIRFGGNSIGGVVHMRTAGAEGERQLQLYANGGSFSTRNAGGRFGGSRGAWAFSGLADYRVADNDFRFRDDNGTEYNTADDEWVRRENSDFLSFRGLAKVARRFGSRRLRLHNILDLSHHGIPGIGNYQSKHTRYDTWRNLTEAEFSGTLQDGRSAYRLTGYHALDVGEYRDPLGEVGVGSAHDRNTTRSFGLKAEGHTVVPGQALLTGYSALLRETFDPDDLVSTDAFEESRRHSASLATEVEIPARSERLLLNVGTHIELLSNRLATTDSDLAGAGRIDDSAVLWGYHLGGRWQLSRQFSWRVNAGLYRRPPSFFELFGDRGAVRGSLDLANEKGRNWDTGLMFQARETTRETGLVFAEAVWYQNRVDNMIRFVQNSQFVSQPHNIGSARLSGLELRSHLRVRAIIDVTGNYVYQRPENQSPFSFENGNDLPNAPRHALNARIVARDKRGALHYEVGRDSRHYLDRANLRPVRARILHGVGANVALNAGTSLDLEVKNLTNNQTADLWGFPLPGRSFFASIRMDATQ